MPTKNTGPNHTCERCGREYFRKRQSRFTSRYCSRECMYISFRGEGNPNYRHGGNQAGLREYVMRHHENACAICGWSLHVHVHHIHARSRGGSNGPENLILLCPNHHWMAHNGYMIPHQLEQSSLLTSPTLPSAAGDQTRRPPIRP